MNRKKTEQVLRQELNKLLPVTAWEDTDGSVYLFNRYRIQCKNSIRVLTDWGAELTFRTRRAAMVWCIANYCGDIQLGNRVKTIDGMLDRTRADIIARSGLRGSDEFKELVLTKLQRKHVRRKELENEMDRCVRLAKQYQRGIANETIRVCST